MGLQPYKFVETYIKKKKKKGRKMVEMKRRRKIRNVFLSTADLELRRMRLLVHALREEDEGLYTRIGWSHVELQVLDFPITQVVDQVVGLSPCDLPMPRKDKS